MVQAVTRRFPDQEREIRFLMASNEAFRELGRDYADVLSALSHGARAYVDPDDQTQQELQRLRRELEHDLATQLSSIAMGPADKRRTESP
jgi:uncharacterized membrane-anchored protein YhcB (DUF1043 family)